MRRVLRWAGYLFAGLIGLVMLAIAGVYGISSYRMSRTYDLPATPLAVRSDAASVERGRHLVAAITKCGDCHGDNLAGKVFIDDPALGRVVAPNLTVGGVGATMTDAQWEQAIRHGVGPDKKPLRIMPSEDWQQLSDEDLATIIAYIRSLPAVSNPLPETSVGPLGRVLFVTGQLPLLPAEHIDHSASPMLNATPAVSTEYGHYLAVTGGCTGCHNPSLSGGKIPGTPPDWPPAANITPAGGIGGWSEADFTKALREGKRPDGSSINPIMPWKATSQMTDDEIKALYLFLKSVPAKAFAEK